jgi:gliding motility-associated-like protein
VHWSDIDPEFISHTTVYDNSTQQILYQDVVNKESMVKVTYADLKESHCFSLSHTNNCGDEGNLSISHCPIILNVTPGANFALNLDWTTYTGWSGVDKYVIYRSVDGVSFEQIAEVDALTQHYTDKLLCDQDYCYSVDAVYQGMKSRSNKDKNRPTYDSYKLPMDVAFATVENNENVYIQWEKAKTQYPVSYLLNTYDAEGLHLLSSIELNKTSFTEDNIDVTAENFVYKVQTVDHCGEKGIEGYMGKPMLLTGYYADDVSQLQWSAYEEWDEGVDYYDIQILDHGEFVSVGTVPGSQTAYVDKEFHDEINGDYVYRIIAVSFTPGVTSTSNHIALRGASFVWIPNAFSPNEDDHNPIFRPTPQFVYLVNDGTYREYEMKIFNRWGEQIFVTNNVEEGWDGTYKSKDCESEVYLYHIRVTGLDRAIYDKKGLVRLMR